MSGCSISINGKSSQTRVSILIINWIVLLIFFNSFCYSIVPEYFPEIVIGEAGKREGQFSYPVGVALSKHGNIYVSDWNNHRVQKFSSTGKFIGVFVKNIERPVGVAVASDGSVFVVSQKGCYVAKFSKTGEEILRFGAPGSATGKFREPRGIAISKNDEIYVADHGSIRFHGNRRVQVFDINGKYLRSIIYKPEKRRTALMPRGVAINAKGEVYITYSGAGLIVKFDKNGKILKKINKIENFSFIQPRYVTLKDSYVYVTDYKKHTVAIFNEKGNLISCIGKYGSFQGGLKNPEGIAVNLAGDIIVADAENDRIQIFTISPQFRHLNLARYYKKKGEHQLAFIEYKKAFSFFPDNSEIREYLKSAYSKQAIKYEREENWAKSKKALLELLKLEPSLKKEIKRKVEWINFQENKWLYFSVAGSIIIAIIFVYIILRLGKSRRKKVF